MHVFKSPYVSSKDSDVNKLTVTMSAVKELFGKIILETSFSQSGYRGNFGGVYFDSSIDSPLPGKSPLTLKSEGTRFERKYYENGSSRVVMV